MKITLVSFGARNGIPAEVMDTIGRRGIRNPHRNRKLRYLTGLDPEVRREVLKHPKAEELITKALGLIWVRSAEGHQEFILGFFCTARHHRSVVVAERVAELLRERGFESVIWYRDINR